MGLYWICFVLLSFHQSFLPSVQLSDKFSLHFFSRTVRVTKLKLGIHMSNGLMYHVYLNQGQGPITLGVTSLDRFYNILLMKIFITDFSGTMKVVKLQLLIGFTIYH